MLQPPFHQTIVFLKFFVLKPKTFMLNKKHNLKSGKNRDKEKGFERKSKTGNHKKEKRLMKKINCHSKFSCCSFQKTKAKKKEK